MLFIFILFFKVDILFQLLAKFKAMKMTDYIL